MDREVLSLRLNGDNEIELTTLIKVLSSTLNSLETIASNTLEGDNYCKFVVKDVRKGSFIVDIKAIVETANGLIPWVTPIIPMFIEIVKLKKFLKGEKPKKIENNNNTTTITNSNGNTITINNVTFNIYISKPQIGKELTKLSKAVIDDSERGSLFLTSKPEKSEEEIIELNKEDLMLMSEDLGPRLMISNLKVEKIIVWLKIKKPDLLGKSKWEVIITSTNTKISVQIIDQQFLEKVSKSIISLSADTKLKVELMVKSRVDDIGNLIGNKSYVVTQVIKVVEPVLV